MWPWAKSNPLAVVIIAVCLMVAAAGAVDSYRGRKLLKAQQVVLEDQARAKEQELRDAEKMWLRVLNSSDAKLAPVLQERDSLRKQLARVDAAPFVPPASDHEIVGRWHGLGYTVRVGPCK
jgi:hypothetical protein